MDTTVVAVSEQVSTRLDDEVVILQLETGRYYEIDGIGPFIWDQLQKSITIEELHHRILSEYDVGAPRAKRDLGLLLTELEEAELIERADERSTNDRRTDER